MLSSMVAEQFTVLLKLSQAALAPQLMDVLPSNCGQKCSLSSKLEPVSGFAICPLRSPSGHKKSAMTKPHFLFLAFWGKPAS